MIVDQDSNEVLSLRTRPSDEYPELVTYLRWGFDPSAMTELSIRKNTDPGVKEHYLYSTASDANALAGLTLSFKKTIKHDPKRGRRQSTLKRTVVYKGNGIIAAVGAIIFEPNMKIVYPSVLVPVENVPTGPAYRDFRREVPEKHLGFHIALRGEDNTKHLLLVNNGEIPVLFPTKIDIQKITEYLKSEIARFFEEVDSRNSKVGKKVS